MDSDDEYDRDPYKYMIDVSDGEDSADEYEARPDLEHLRNDY